MTNSKRYIVGFAAGLIFCFVINNFICSGEPEVKTEKTTKIMVKISPGVPDTAVVVKKEEKSVRLRKESKQIGYELSSRFLNSFELENGRIETEVITYPAADSIDINLNAKIKERTITRTDTLIKTITNETITTKTDYVKASWNLSLGSFQFIDNEINLHKYAMVSYQHKIWFFYIEAGAGVYNGLSDGFNNFKLLTKAELKIPLN
ncbi:MAG: hypothetical protein Kow0098_03670 [Ignavibacteriaceae bacterium]